MKLSSIDHHPPSAKRREFGEGWKLNFPGVEACLEKSLGAGASWVVPSLGEGVKHVRGQPEAWKEPG